MAYLLAAMKMNSLFNLILTCFIGCVFADVICDGTNPCLNSGLCTGEIDQNGTLTTECRCFPPFTGRLCDAFECPINPCQNNASCEYNGKNFKCVCPRGYIGNFCETRQPMACDSLDCGNGECSLANGHLEVPVCKCHKGFSGLNCREVDHCNPDSCSGHGECMNHRKSFSCKCNVGFEGQFCENNIDECLHNTCAQGSTCIDNIAGYDCICQTGKIGPLCQFNDPCFNDFIVCGSGTCHSTFLGEVICQCPEGLQGDFCQLDIDECAVSNKCAENSECKNTHGSYFCACDDGFYGDFCEITINYQPATSVPPIFDPFMALTLVAVVFCTITVLFVVMLLKKCFAKLRKPSEIEIYNCCGEVAFYEVTVSP